MYINNLLLTFNSFVTLDRLTKHTTALMLTDQRLNQLCVAALSKNKKVNTNI